MRLFETVKQECRKFPNMEIKLPERAGAGSAGHDFYSNEDYTLAPNTSHIFWTDVKARLYYDNVLNLFPRSGNGVKYGIVLRNSVGVIDSDYYNNPSNDGNIGICLYNSGDEDFHVSVGDRIAQGVVSKYLVMSNDKFRTSKNKGQNLRTGGFGSTGK